MSGILDKKKYTSETLNTYGFLSAYFIDLFYNHLYDQAVRYHRQKQVDTITDGYKRSLDAFSNSINKHDPELYRDIVSGIYQTFINYGYTGLSYNNCIDKIVKEFIPQDYWKIMSFEDKSKILGTVITNSTNDMIRKIITKYLEDVIDNHYEPDNANIWQDEFVDILLLEREKLFQNIINVKTGGTTSSDPLIDAMKKEIKLLANDKKLLQKTAINFKKKILELNKIILAKQKELADMHSKYDELLLKTNYMNQNKPNVQSNSVNQTVNKTNNNKNYQINYQNRMQFTDHNPVINSNDEQKTDMDDVQDEGGHDNDVQNEDRQDDEPDEDRQDDNVQNEDMQYDNVQNEDRQDDNERNVSFYDDDELYLLDD